jgi:hypothetical protein
MGKRTWSVKGEKLGLESTASEGGCDEKRPEVGVSGMELGLKGRAREAMTGTEGALTSSCMSSFDDTH